MKSVSRRELVSRGLGGSKAARVQSTSSKAKPSKLADVGWSWEGQGLTGGAGEGQGLTGGVWEGQGFTGGAGLSIFGVGEGAEYWGLRKVIYMFQPVNTLALGKLRQFEEVVCEITPAVRPIHCGNNCIQMDSLTAYGQRAEDLFQEAEALGRLSLTYRNITGGYIDDPPGRPGKKPHEVTAELFSSVQRKLTNANSNLKLWAMIWAAQLDEEDWAGFKPHMDVVKVGIPWATMEKELPELDRRIEKCREVFPGRPIILDSIIFQFAPVMRPMPMELVKAQWERILKYVQAGKIDGYAILGTFLIDGAQEQARWIRDFIAAN